MKKLTIFPNSTSRIEFPLEDGVIRIVWNIGDESVGEYNQFTFNVPSDWEAALNDPSKLSQLARLTRQFLTFWKRGIAGVNGRTSADMTVLSSFTDKQLRFLERMWKQKLVDGDSLPIRNIGHGMRTEAGGRTFTEEEARAYFANDSHVKWIGYCKDGRCWLVHYTPSF